MKIDSIDMAAVCHLRWYAIAAALLLTACVRQEVPPGQPELGSRHGTLLRVAGLSFRDLNRNGTLEPYEDWRLDAAARARDLVGRMTLEEKAGAMMHGTARMDAGGYDLAGNEVAILQSHVTSFITRLSLAPAALAEQNNALQAIAERGRLGIPVTISTDPRSHFQVVSGASVEVGGFSQWPETLGFAAIGDVALVRQFADIARQEYRAVGIHAALSPQADLATEPRWPRINGTFGEDATLAGQLVGAYVEGFQGGRDGLRASSVQTVVKHWVGYGAAKDGFDAHNFYGRFAVFPGNAFEYHVRPFEAAFAAQVAGVMPTYSILENLHVDGQLVEQVGGGFNSFLLNDLLRGKYGFKGIILSDWKITEDCDRTCREGFPPSETPTFVGLSTAWGVEHLSKVERFTKGVLAGLDQFGGTEEAQYVVAAVRSGQLTEARIDASVERIMMQKFQLGLFDNPYVDAGRAAQIVGAEAFTALAREAQAQSVVVLENKNRLLPLNGDINRVYLHRVDPAVAQAHGFTVVSDPTVADIAIVRTSAPYETLHPNYVFGAMQHEGDLSFKEDSADYQAIRTLASQVPTIVSVYLDRPAILTNIKDHTAVLLGEFGVSDAALFDVLTGKIAPIGKLPFELPSSMDEVRAQAPDLPHDTQQPLYPIRFGLTVQ